MERVRQFRQLLSAFYLNAEMVDAGGAGPIGNREIANQIVMAREGAVR
jgi:hypothetical protein